MATILRLLREDLFLWPIVDWERFTRSAFQQNSPRSKFSSDFCWSRKKLVGAAAARKKRFQRKLLKFLFFYSELIFCLKNHRNRFNRSSKNGWLKSEPLFFILRICFSCYICEKTNGMGMKGHRADRKHSFFSPGCPGFDSWHYLVSRPSQMQIQSTNHPKVKF